MVSVLQQVHFIDIILSDIQMDLEDGVNSTEEHYSCR